MPRAAGLLATLIVAAVLAAVGTALLVGLPRLDGAVDVEEAWGLPWLYARRGPVAAPNDVIVVAIDEASARELGLPARPGGWPRSLHARLVRALAAAGAAVIVFDMSFETPSAEPGGDAAFAAAMHEAGNVLVAAVLKVETVAVAGSDAVMTTLVPPIDAVDAAALGHAPFIVPKSGDLNYYWPFVDGGRGGEPVATLPVMAAARLAPRAWDLAAAWAGRPAAAGGAEDRDGLHRAAALYAHLHAEPRALQQVLARFDREAPTLQSGLRAPLAAALRLLAAGDAGYLNLYGPPRSIATVPYTQALAAGGADAGLFRGKAVFVGYSAAVPGGQDRLRDNYRTPYTRTDGLELSGVEIAATATANLLDGRVLQPTDVPMRIAVAVACALLLAALASLLPLKASMPLVALVALSYAAAAQAAFERSAEWWPIVVPLAVQAPLALVLGLGLWLREARADRRRIRAAVGYFLPDDVVDRLAHDVRSVTQGQRVVFGACLVTDAERYTALAESMSLEALGAFMNAYYARLFAPVERWGGRVVDVVGDSMVAVWTGTDAPEELRRRACRAALDLQAALHAADAPALRTRIGLHSGRMLVGSVGAGRHYEYRAVGDIVNTASRIEGLNKLLGTQLIAEHDTVAALDGIVRRPLGRFELSGKAEAVDVVELAGEPSSARHALHKGFGTALALYEAGRCDEALQAWQRLQVEHPDDGPTRFYVARCLALAATRTEWPAPSWSPIVRVTDK